jgi:Cu(I)/Ag(I) efflux system membrane protein CusA/SilA
MVEKLISFSLKNRFLVVILVTSLFAWGIMSVTRNPIDAIPDVSENQVIVFTEWAGRSPQVIEDQVTFPLVSNLQGIPDVKTVRGSSMFGMSFIYLIFEDKTDVYWARTRVLERLNSAQQLLPSGVTPTIGPDGTGVGHIFWYTLEGRGYDLGELRALQDWYVKYALQTVPGVSEVASFGGFQKQYQVSIDPHKLNYYNIPLADVLDAVRENNNDVSGRKLEISDVGYIIRGLGYIQNTADIEKIPVGVFNSVPVYISDLGSVGEGGDLRLGIFDENGEGEAVGGIIVMRYNQNADKVITAVKAKMDEVAKGLPEGVKFKTAYDRSVLIREAVKSVKGTLLEEMLAVSVVVLLFLFHWRSAMIILIQMPISIAVSFILLNAMGITSNIMSLTGIILAIGVIVDDTIVMVENSYRHLADESDPDNEGESTENKQVTA